MPKKFASENSKAVAAKAKKSSTKETELAKKQKEQEDAAWKDDDKHIQKKQQRKVTVLNNIIQAIRFLNLKEEQEKKRLAAVEKKAEAKMLLEQEMSSISKVKGKAQPPEPKLTRAQIETAKIKPAAAATKETVETHLTVPLEENINRLVVDGEEARSITEAIAILRYHSLVQNLHYYIANFIALHQKRLINIQKNV